MAEHDPLKEYAVRQFLSIVDPRSGDASADYGTLLDRAQAVLVQELSIWANAGTSAAPAPAPAAAPEE